jgi:cystathionine beta-lyase/cystathionine gamma-synthase
MKLDTRLIHHPGSECEHTGAVSPPIYQVSTFRQEKVGVSEGYDYSRTGNPTREVLEDYIAELEGAAGGVAFGSGMAAISSCLMMLKAGDHLIATEGLYGGTYRVLRQVFDGLGVRCTFADTTDLDAVAEAFQENTRAVLIETPSNPLMRISDIAGIAEMTHEHDALLMVDNTFMSPYLQRPLENGADIVIHSATKFLGGHSDAIDGLAAARERNVYERIRRVQNTVGAIPSPLDCWIVIRGMKTLGVRLERGQSSAGRIARWLTERPEVEHVYYPGLGTLRGDEVHARQSDGPGAIVSFRLRECHDPDALLESVSVWTLAVSLGGVESIITQPAKMTHLPYSRRELGRLGICDNLIRLSVGIEDPDDLIEELARGLDLTSGGV